jgi:muconate cycloisomerase
MMEDANPLKITRIETVPVSIPYKGKFRTSREVRPKKADYVLLKMYADDGIIGIGESDTGPQFGNGETQSSVIQAIDDCLAPAVVGEDPFNIELILKKMDQALVSNWFAKAAIEVALLDVIGKKLNVPLYRLLGGLYRERVAISRAITSTAVADVISEAEHAISEGFFSIKIKVGWLDPQKELERLKALRDTVGCDVCIIIDANQAWNTKSAIKILRKAEDLDIAFCEQPVPRWDLKGMSEVRSATSISIVADESLWTYNDAVNLIRCEAADAFNVYLLKSGGMWNSKRIISLAEAANMPCRIGSEIELDILAAAATHVASSSPNVSIASDTGSPLFFEDRLVTDPLRIENGFVHTPNKPGLGVELDEEKLNHYMK